MKTGHALVRKSVASAKAKLAIAIVINVTLRRELEHSTYLCLIITPTSSNEWVLHNKQARIYPFSRDFARRRDCHNTVKVLWTCAEYR